MYAEALLSLLASPRNCTWAVISIDLYSLVLHWTCSKLVSGGGQQEIFVPNFGCWLQSQRGRKAGGQSSEWQERVTGELPKIEDLLKDQMPVRSGARCCSFTISLPSEHQLHRQSLCSIWADAEITCKDTSMLLTLMLSFASGF